jgi:hypothetical protein
MAGKAAEESTDRLDKVRTVQPHSIEPNVIYYMPTI